MFILIQVVPKLPKRQTN